MRPAPTVSEPRQPKILLIDIETVPILGLSWQLFDTDILHVLAPTSTASFAYQWFGQERVHTKALWDFKGYKRPPRKASELEAILHFYLNNEASERWLLSHLWELLDEADIVVAHNGDQFDIKKINARLIVHGFGPYAPVKSVDTLKISRRNFKFDSNKLDNVGGYLGVGRKMPHTGKHLWLGCMRGDTASQRTMKDYNAQDVRLLHSTYEKLRGWDKSHPVLTAISPRLEITCPTCLTPGAQRRGWNIAKFRKTPRFQCMSEQCGAWFSGAGHLPKIEAA